MQDPAIHKYVTLVGTVVAKQFERPSLPWTFIVLDTDGVNAFASPGGFVHITRGALGLAKNEAQLAAVLAHEIGHVAHKHTVNSIQNANREKLVSDAMLADRNKNEPARNGLFASHPETKERIARSITSPARRAAPPLKRATKRT